MAGQAHGKLENPCFKIKHFQTARRRRPEKSIKNRLSQKFYFFP